jgi:hypothetical protein
VDTRNRWPLIRFVKYHTSPRFSKAMTCPLSHPPVELIAIEANQPPLPDERDVASIDAVIDGVRRHAQVARRRGDVEPVRVNGRILNNVCRLHGVPRRCCPRWWEVAGGDAWRRPRCEWFGVALGFSDASNRPGHGPRLSLRCRRDDRHDW